jgi:uncharacterized protein (TIGR02284 family)
MNNQQHYAETPINRDIPRGTDYESNDDVISTLNDLIEVCRDGQQGLKEAAEGVKRSDLKTVLYEFSQQRAEFAGVLQSLVRSLGGEPETEGSFSGALHRGWIDLKSAITGKDDQAILNECERGEDSAKDSYADALKMNLPANVETIVRQQSQSVQAAHNRIKELRDNRSSTATTRNM